MLHTWRGSAGSQTACRTGAPSTVVPVWARHIPVPAFRSITRRRFSCGVTSHSWWAAPVHAASLGCAPTAVLPPGISMHSPVESIRSRVRSPERAKAAVAEVVAVSVRATGGNEEAETGGNEEAETEGVAPEAAVGVGSAAPDVAAPGSTGASRTTGGATLPGPSAWGTAT